MADIEKILKDVVYGGVGVVASAIEAGSDLARTVVQKGQEVVQNSQAVQKELVQKGSEVLQKGEDAVKKAREQAAEQQRAAHEACVELTGIDVTQLTRDQRDALRADLLLLAAADRAAACKQAMEDAADTQEEDDEPEEPAEPEEPEAYDAPDEADEETIEAVTDEDGAVEPEGTVTYDVDDNANG